MKISEERIKWVLRDYEGVLKYCDARYENYRRSYICEKQELQNFVQIHSHHLELAMNLSKKILSRRNGHCSKAVQKQRLARNVM